MRRYRKGQTWRPPTAEESATHADALESHRRQPGQPQDRTPVGQDIVVLTPVGGIDAADGDTIYSELCQVCIEVDGASETKTFVETDEYIRVYNLYADDVGAEIRVVTSLTFYGTRYVSGEACP